MRTFLIVGGLFLVILFAKSGAAQELQLLTPAPGVRAFQASLFENSRFVRFDPTLFTSRSKASIAIDLFDGEQVSIVPDEFRFNQNSGGIMIGRILDHPLSEVVFSWDGKIGAGTVNLGNGDIYRLRYTANGEHVFEQLPANFLPEGVPIFPPMDQVRRVDSSDDHPVNDVAIVDQEQTDLYAIDILVLYTPAAEKAMGGASATRNTLNIAEAESNQGFSNSLVNMEFNIVHSHKIDFDESPYSFSDMLGGLTTKEDGVLDEVHSLRDLYGADIVTLIVDRPLLCGKTYQNTGNYQDFSQFAFVVVHQSCMTGYYSFAHEIGHVMGSQHNRTNASSNPVFQFGYGYQDPSHQFRTIMAYNCPVSCTRINHWSNPAVQYKQILPTGVSSGSHDGAHNSLSLARMAPIVSQFRTPRFEANQPIKINFQAESADHLKDYVSDAGAEYGDRGDGLAYGWHNVADFSAGGETMGAAELSYIVATAETGDQVNWEILVPNGTYRVRLVSGNQSEAQTPASLVVESQTVTRNDAEDSSNQSDGSVTNFDEEVEISVQDGNLTVVATTDQLLLNLVEVTLLANTLPEIPYDELTSVNYLPIVR